MGNQEGHAGRQIEDDEQRATLYRQYAARASTWWWVALAVVLALGVIAEGVGYHETWIVAAGCLLLGELIGRIFELLRWLS